MENAVTTFDLRDAIHPSLDMLQNTHENAVTTLVAYKSRTRTRQPQIHVRMTLLGGRLPPETFRRKGVLRRALGGSRGSQNQRFSTRKWSNFYSPEKAEN